MKLLKKLYNFINDDVPYHAASLSFFTIFAILPLIALLIVVISNLPSFKEYADLLLIYILDFINPTRSEALAKSLENFLQNTDKLGDIGMIYLLFVFTMFFRDYEHIINKIYGSEARPVYKLFFMYLSFLVLIPILFFVSVFLTTLSSVTDVSILGRIYSFTFMWCLFIILFIISANTKITFFAASIASLVTLVSLSITKSLFGYYVMTNKTYATIYGSFSVVLFFFLWIYVSWIIYLYGTKLCSILNKGKLDNEN